jgi:UDP-3-O-[3-hydroxymyristoyl] N-acetylglucosamine deacetylase
MKIIPALAETGIVFVRTDVMSVSNSIPALVKFVEDTTLCTRVANAEGVSVSTIEHALAGLAACGVHNAVIEVDQEELPALDGSALKYAEEILRAGVRHLDAPVKIIKILERVEAAVGDARASIEPSDQAEMEFTIEFPDPIGTQQRSMVLSNGAIVRNLTDSRTFCIESQIVDLRRRGFGLGGTYENVLVADCANNRFIGQIRHLDECVRHKMLDAVGDLALAGHPIIGRFSGYRAGHETTVALLDKLLATDGAFETIVAGSDAAAKLPGAGTNFADIPTIQ